MTRARTALAAVFLVAAGLSVPIPSRACTSIVATRGATADGSTMVTYVADSHELYGELYQVPAGRHRPDETLEVFEWDTGKHLGPIRQAPVTYATLGNINEHQVAISETTFGGRKELRDPTGGIDYGSLIYVALQRARTAREAIGVMTSLAAEYGYSSEGETFSVGDPREAWLLEMVGKGPKGKGALWVAVRVPDGMVTAHANHARIRTFPLHDPRTALYAPDVIDWARKAGWFTGRDADFSFADTYNPLTFGALRYCDARVWSVFRRVAPHLDLPADMVRGVPGAKPLPMWVRPEKPLTARDVMELMRDHFEGTEFDLSVGVGSGPFNLPYRWRPLEWDVDGQKYLNERSISTQQTGFSLVAQLRPGMPDPIGGVLWFGVDDTYSTVYVPVYCGNRSAPHAYAVGTGTFQRFSWDSAFWVFNWVASITYGRYRDIIPEVRAVQRRFEGEFESMQAEVEARARALWTTSPEAAREYLTDYTDRQAARVVARWKKLGEELFVRYLDGNVRDEAGKVNHPPLPTPYYREIIRERGEAVKVKPLPGEIDQDD